MTFIIGYTLFILLCYITLSININFTINIITVLYCCKWHLSLSIFVLYCCIILLLRLLLIFTFYCCVILFSCMAVPLLWELLRSWSRSHRRGGGGPVPQGQVRGEVMKTIEWRIIGLNKKEVVGYCFCFCFPLCDFHHHPVGFCARGPGLCMSPGKHFWMWGMLPLP